MLTEYDQRELDKRLNDPEFSNLYNELIFLGPLRYPGLTVQYGPLNASGNNGEITPDDLDRRDLKFRLFSNNEKRAIDMLRNAQWLADKMAYFFPSAKHRHWQTIFTIMAMNGHTWLAKIGQRQAGKPPGLDNDERLYRSEKAQEAIRLRQEDDSITWKEIAREINWRHGWRQAGIKKLQRAVKEYENGQ